MSLDPNGTRARFENDTGYAPIDLTGSDRTDIAWSLDLVDGQWVFTDEDDTTEIYDAAGILQSITYRDGYTITFFFDEHDNIYRVVDSFGRALLFTYSIGDLLTSMTDPDGRVTRYEYGDTSNFSNPSIAVWPGAKTPFTPLEKVFYPDDTPANDADNPYVQYHYEESGMPHALTGIAQAGGWRRSRRTVRGGMA